MGINITTKEAKRDLTLYGGMKYKKSCWKNMAKNNLKQAVMENIGKCLCSALDLQGLTISDDEDIKVGKKNMAKNSSG